MSELNYNLFHLRTAENIKVELIKLRESLLKGGQNNAEIHSDVPSIDSLLSDNILDFKDLNPNNNQLKTRKYWHDFLTETSHLSFIAGEYAWPMAQSHSQLVRLRTEPPKQRETQCPPHTKSPAVQLSARFLSVW